MPKKEKKFKKIAGYIINGKKISLWSTTRKKKLYMNLGGNKLFIYKIDGCGDGTPDFRKGKTTFTPTKADKREILFNLQRILEKEKRPRIKDIIQNILHAMKSMPVN